MIKHRGLLLTLLAATVLGSLTLTGCSDQEKDTGTTVQNAETTQAEIDRIKNNPNLPPQAKAAALREMEQKMNAAKQAQQLEGQAPK